MAFFKFIKQGYATSIELGLIDSVTELPPKARLPQMTTNTHGALVIALKCDKFIVLTSNAEINGFYAAFCPVAMPGQPVITSPLGTP